MHLGVLRFLAIKGSHALCVCVLRCMVVSNSGEHCRRTRCAVSELQEEREFMREVYHGEQMM